MRNAHLHFCNVKKKQFRPKAATKVKVFEIVGLRQKTQLLQAFVKLNLLDGPEFEREGGRWFRSVKNDFYLN